MRFIIAAAAVAALAGAAFAASSNSEVKAHCEAYVAKNGGDASGCGCLADKAASDPALADALLAIDSPEALEAASDATKEAIGACFPDAD